MEEWAQNFGWKKVVAILIVASVLGLIYVVFSMFQINRPRETANNQLNQNRQNQNQSNGNQDGSSGLSNTSPNTPASFKKVNAKGFSFSYPSNYQLSNVDNSVESPIIGLKGPQNVSIDLHSFPASIPVSSIVKNYIDKGFLVEDFQSGDYTGKMYTGVLTTNPPTRIQAIILTGDFVVFAATLTYQSGVQKSDIEKTFQEIVRSVRF